MKLVVLTSDKTAIRNIWHERANLTRPEPLKRQALPPINALKRASGLPPAIQ